MKHAVGIMGGTFDPIHFGHLVAAEEARRCFRLARVIFIPNGRPPHKKEYGVSPAQTRCDMLVLATASNPAFEVSRIEVDRPGPSYAVDTVGEIKRQVGDDTPLYFITGADAIVELTTWHEPARLAEMCEFIAVMRPGYDLQRLERALRPDFMARTRLLQIPGVDISSTEIRRRAGSGESLRYLTPEAVVRYIESRRLYREMPVRSSVATAGDPPGADR
jgi:nicotinate-nucleotide adenylyltransferase